METRHTEQYYRKYWADYIKPTNDPHYLNLEESLDKHMAIFTDLPEAALSILRKQEAKKIAEETTALLKEDMKIAKQIDTCSFGYTTMAQEVAAKRNFIERFEFNCLQLADFKKKYLSITIGKKGVNK